MSNIEWTDRSWNPVVGCTKISEGCRNCYAFNLHNSRHKAYQEGKLQHIPQYSKPFDDVQLLPERLISPLRWKKPQKIFVNSMSDLFHEDVPFEFIDKVFSVMALAQQHTFQILTKRPERMLEFMKRTEWRESVGLADWPLSNVWLGVSVENQQAADKRIPLLLETPATVRFLSCEPLLGEVNLKQIDLGIKKTHGYGNRRIIWDALTGWEHQFDPMLKNQEIPRSSLSGPDRKIHWVIVGGESGPKARPMHPNWARSLRDQCEAAEVPFFFKQWGEWAQVHELRSGEPGIRGKLWYNFDPDTSVCRVGRRSAGRLLDGVLYEQFPSEREDIYR